MRIGKLAEASSVSIETIRFYERKGLLADPKRRPSGYRIYDDSVVDRLQFIRRAKSLGFTLSEIKELVDSKVDCDDTSEQVRNRVARKIEDIDSKIRNLQAMKKSLTSILENCHGDIPAECCPLMRDNQGNGET